jgi:hypothetical protein
MHLLLSLALVLCFVALLMLGFLGLARELLMRDFFGAPSLPNVPPQQTHMPESETESHSLQRPTR